MKDNTAPLYKVIKFFFGPIFRLGFRPKIVNKKVIPKEGPIIFCGNHKHDFDPCMVALSTRRKVHFMSKKENLEHKQFGFVVRNAGVISVDRSIKDNEAKEKCIEILKNGWALGIFPEGTRNKTTDLLLPFKPGVISFAKKTDATLIPFAIIGKYKFWGKRMKIVFGTPYKPQDDDYEVEAKKLQKKVEKMLLEG